MLLVSRNGHCYRRIADAPFRWRLLIDVTARSYDVLVAMLETVRYILCLLVERGNPDSAVKAGFLYVTSEMFSDQAIASCATICSGRGKS